MVTTQQRWNRYVHAINYCLKFGYYINIIDSKANDAKWNGNIRAIRVRQSDFSRDCIIPLKPRKYGKQELLCMIIDKIGYPKSPK